MVASRRFVSHTKHSIRGPLLVVLIALTLGGPARADGVMVVDEETWKRSRERAMINEPEQKAAVYLSGDTEELIISPSYEGESSNFAWVLPVPSRPKVAILKGALFHELMKLTAPKPGFVKKRADTQSAAPAGVTVLERKTVGAYDISVLSATDPRALTKWLAANRYRLPEKAFGPVGYYVQKRWTFVACRIKAPESAKGLRTGTLAPLRLTFRTKQPIYPLRITSANPKPFALLVYLLLPTAGIADKNAVKISAATKTWRDYWAHKMHWGATVRPDARKHPTLFRLCRNEIHIYVLGAHDMRPEDCTDDIGWVVPKRA